MAGSAITGSSGHMTWTSPASTRTAFTSSPTKWTTRRIAAMATGPASSSSSAALTESLLDFHRGPKQGHRELFRWKRRTRNGDVLGWTGGRNEDIVSCAGGAGDHDVPVSVC